MGVYAKSQQLLVFCKNFLRLDSYLTGAIQFIIMSTNRLSSSDGFSVMIHKYKMLASAVVHLDKLICPGVKFIAFLNLESGPF